MTVPHTGSASRNVWLVVGLSPYRLLDPGYQSFLHMVAGQVGANIANAQAYEDERRRADALAELDRAKTAFFSNISHEFRTPLTLMLGPVEEALRGTQALIGEDLASVHRNSQRLLRLVNALLDFSRIEAGRVQARYVPVELGPFTAELASMFRSATEKAGLRLDVDVPALSSPVFVDREMWEKIVLNLLSNAFKFTFDGGIRVALRELEHDVELVVEDTGIGIAPEELPRLFERFHRVQDARARTHEGSGIGLALVQELVKLHGGRIDADSTPGTGTRFTRHDPARHRASAGGSDRRSRAGDRRPAPRPRVTWRKPSAGCDRTDDAVAGAASPTVDVARHDPARRRQRRHARLRAALARRRWLRVHAVGNGNEALVAHRRIAARPGADRRDDAGPRWLRPDRGAARRSAHARPARRHAVRARGRRRAGRRPGRRRRRLPRQAVLGEGVAGARVAADRACAASRGSRAATRCVARALRTGAGLHRVVARTVAGLRAGEPALPAVVRRARHPRQAHSRSLAGTRGRSRSSSCSTQVRRTGVPYVGTETSVYMDATNTGRIEEHVFNFLYQPIRDVESGEVDCGPRLRLPGHRCGARAAPCRIADATTHHRRPAQGRIPRDARARAAQSARAGAQRHRAAAGARSAGRTHALPARRRCSGRRAISAAWSTTCSTSRASRAASSNSTARAWTCAASWIVRWKACRSRWKRSSTMSCASSPGGLRSSTAIRCAWNRCW